MGFNSGFKGLKYTYIQGYMFQLHRAIIRPLPQNRSISEFLYNWDPNSLQCWSIIVYGVWLS